ncbi:MAG: ABC transporter ATP-binding protein [Lachnospiraceae bacterium]|nr:ABC transporter ATP-binding protein [Lachnospiraceae bacterium]
MENVIEVNGLRKQYDGFALKDVSFSVPMGSITGFIGQNGAGKTTTIYSILNIIQQDAGTIRIWGKDPVQEEHAVKEEIGVVFDEMGYHDVMTPAQLNKMMKYVYRNWQEETFFSYLERFGLSAKKKCGKFSRGMRMKLQIAVALSHQPSLLVMDEPTSGLDPIVRNEILDIFQEFVEEEEHTILLSSHIIGDLERIADKIVFIHQGELLFSDHKDRLLEQHGILRVKKQEREIVRDEDVVSIRTSAYGAEILVRDREECRRRYPNLLMEPATLEEIMLFYVSRGSQMLPCDVPTDHEGQIGG